MIFIHHLQQQPPQWWCILHQPISKREKDQQHFHPSRPFHRWGQGGRRGSPTAAARARSRLVFLNTAVELPVHPASAYKHLLITFNNVVLFAFSSLVNVTHDRGLPRCSAFYLSCRALSSVCSNTWKVSRRLLLAPFLFCSLTPFPWLFHSTHTEELFGEMGGAEVLAKDTYCS